MDKIDLLIIIGNEVCEGCGPDRDCGEEIDECFRIVNALKSLNDYICELKAYVVFPGNNPYDDGCVLVFAESRNKARSFAVWCGPWIGNTYLEMNARRVKQFDKYAPTKPTMYETDDGLPEPFFTDYD